MENYDLFKQYLIVERDADNPNRLNTLFPPDYVNQYVSLRWLTSSVSSIQRSQHNGKDRRNLFF